jgi:hypothetical protein
VAEGQLFAALLDKLKTLNEGKFPANEIEDWNDRISKHHERYGNSQESNFEGLGVLEQEFCVKWSLDRQMYLAIKNLLIREYAIYGSLAREEVVMFAYEWKREILLVYDFCVENGWIGR